MRFCGPTQLRKSSHVAFRRRHRLRSATVAALLSCTTVTYTHVAGRPRTSVLLARRATAQSARIAAQRPTKRCTLVSDQWALNATGPNLFLAAVTAFAAHFRFRAHPLLSSAASEARSFRASFRRTSRSARAPSAVVGRLRGALRSVRTFGAHAISHNGHTARATHALPLHACTTARTS